MACKGLVCVEICNVIMCFLLRLASFGRMANECVRPTMLECDQGVVATEY